MANESKAIALLTNRFNEFIQAAKKVDELDPQQILNTSSKLHVMVDGVSQYLTIQQILDAFVEVTFKELVSVGDITLDAEEISFTDVIWKIEGVSFTKTNQIDIPLALAGNIRNDIFVGNNNGEIERIPGIESDSIAITPQTPFDKVYITQVTVTDSGVEEPEPPVIGNLYVEKQEVSAHIVNSGGVIGTIGISDKKSRILFPSTGTVSQVSAVSKIYSHTYYDGQLLCFDNRQMVEILLKHNDTGASGARLFFYDEKDLLLSPGQRAYFVWDAVNYRLLFSHVTAKDFAKMSDLNDYKQNVAFDFLFNTILATFPLNVGAISGGTLINQSDSIPIPLRTNRPFDVIEAWGLRGSASAPNSGYYAGIASQNPLYTGCVVFMVINPCKLVSQKGRYGTATQNALSPLANSTIMAVEIDEANLNFKTGDTAGIMSTGPTLILTDVNKWLYVLFEVGESEIRCKIRDGYAGSILYNWLLPVNGVKSSSSNWVQQRLTMTAINKTASADTIVQLGRVYASPKKPNWLKNF